MTMNIRISVTGGTNKGEIKRVKEENDVFLPKVVREVHLRRKIDKQIKLCVNKNIHCQKRAKIRTLYLDEFLIEDCFGLKVRSSVTHQREALKESRKYP